MGQASFKFLIKFNSKKAKGLRQPLVYLVRSGRMSTYTSHVTIRKLVVRDCARRYLHRYQSNRHALIRPASPFQSLDDTDERV